MERRIEKSTKEKTYKGKDLFKAASRKGFKRISITTKLTHPICEHMKKNKKIAVFNTPITKTTQRNLELCTKVGVSCEFSNISSKPEEKALLKTLQRYFINV